MSMDAKLYIGKIQEIENFYNRFVTPGVLNQFVVPEIKYDTKTKWHTESMCNRPPSFWFRITKGKFYRRIVLEEVGSEVVYVCYRDSQGEEFVNMKRKVETPTSFLELIFGDNFGESIKRGLRFD